MYRNTKMRAAYYFERLQYQINLPLQTIFTTTPRKVLFGLNFCLSIFSLGLVAFSLFLISALFHPTFTSGWVNWLGLAVVGMFLASIAIIGMRGSHLVSIELILIYFWGIIMFVAPLLLGIFACFNYFIYLRIWFKHQWDQPSFSSVRSVFCSPRSTADTLCVAPLEGNVTQTCIDEYKSTQCEGIRDRAIENAVEWGQILIVVQSSVGLFCMVLMVPCVYLSHVILTSPVITQSMNDVINYFLILPIIGCLAEAGYLWWMNVVNLDFAWYPIMLLVVGLAQVCALPLGIVAGRLKSRRLLTIYICVVALISLGLTCAGIIGFQFAENIRTEYEPEDQQITSDFACRKELIGCCCCGDDLSVNQCPEWSTKEITTLMALDVRLAACVSILSILYLIGALIVSSLVHSSLKNYKSDFV